jgi:hypothetical protein
MFDKLVEKLGKSEIQQIETQYDDAVSTEHGSGEHWVLMATLDKYGFRTHSPDAAIKKAEEIITRWYQLNP